MEAIEVDDVEPSEQLNRAAVVVAVTKWTALFSKDFEPKSYVYKLRAQNYLTDDEASAIWEEKLHERRVCQFADYLRTKDLKLYASLLRCLEENSQSHLADDLRKLYVDACSQGFGNTSIFFEYPPGFIEGERNAMSISRHEYVNFALEKLANTTSNRLKFAVLHGLSGIGKTQIAIQIASSEQIKAIFPDGILFCHLQQYTREDFRRELRMLFERLLRALSGNVFGVNAMTENRFLLEHYIGDCVTLLADKKVLLILDDIWTALLEKDKSTVDFFLRLNVPIVCTTQDNWCALATVSTLRGFEFSETEVCGFNENETEEFVRRRTTSFRSEGYSIGDIVQLHRQTDGHPLTTEIIVASYANNNLDGLQILDFFDSQSCSYSQRFANAMETLLKLVAAQNYTFELQILMAGAFLTLGDLSWFVQPWFPFGCGAWSVKPTAHRIKIAFQRLKQFHLVSSYTVRPDMYEAHSFRIHAMIRTFLVDRGTASLMSRLGVTRQQQRTFCAVNHCVQDCIVSMEFSPGVDLAGFLFRLPRYRCRPFLLLPRRITVIFGTPYFWMGSRWAHAVRFLVVFSVFETCCVFSALTYALFVVLAVVTRKQTYLDFLRYCFALSFILSWIVLTVSFVYASSWATSQKRTSSIICLLRIWWTVAIFFPNFLQVFNFLYIKPGTPWWTPLLLILVVILFLTLMLWSSASLRKVPLHQLRDEVLLPGTLMAIFRWNAFRVPIWLLSATTNFVTFVLFLFPVFVCRDPYIIVNLILLVLLLSSIIFVPLLRRRSISFVFYGVLCTSMVIHTIIRISFPSLTSYSLCYRCNGSLVLNFTYPANSSICCC